jgi:hypothetical protein
MVLPQKNDIFIQSSQIAIYDDKENRKGFDTLYLSERKSLEHVMDNVKSVTDIGCLNGDTFAAILDKYPNRTCRGIDIDVGAIDVAKQRYPDMEYHIGDFLDPSFNIEKSDLVIAFNLFDHFEDWKQALRNLKRFSSRYINISSLMRLNGPTLTDKDTSFIYYGGDQKRLLWAPHNIFELASYCACEEINATSIYVYCYHKYNRERFDNVHRAQHVSHPFPPSEMIVGNMVIEFDDNNGMMTSNNRPDFKIILDDEVYFDSPWKK